MEPKSEYDFSLTVKKGMIEGGAVIISLALAGYFNLKVIIALPVLMALWRAITNYIKNRNK